MNDIEFVYKADGPMKLKPHLMGDRNPRRNPQPALQWRVRLIECVSPEVVKELYAITGVAVE